MLQQEAYSAILPPVDAQILPFLGLSLKIGKYLSEIRPNLHAKFHADGKAPAEKSVTAHTYIHTKRVNLVSHPILRVEG